MKEEEPTRRYAIRKLTVGAASVLIGLAFVSAKPTSVHADTINGGKVASQNTTDANAAQASQKQPQAQVVKTTAPQTNNNQNQNANTVTVSSHDAFFNGSGLSSDAFTLPNTKRDATAPNWERPSSNTNNSGNSNTNTNQGANSNSASQGNVNSNISQGSNNASQGANIAVGQNQGTPSQNTETATQKQANQAVQNNLSGTGDVQGNGTVEKNQNVHYVDKDTGKDIAKSDNISVDFVPYFKKATGTITYRDASDNSILGTQTIHGYVGGQVTLTTGQLEGYVNQGYKISSDTTLNQRFADGENDFTIDLDHNVITQGGRTIETSQTVHFVDENGNDLIDPKVQSDSFVYTPTITDKVTGDTTPGGNWNMVDKTFDDVVAPVIPGYLATQGSVKGAHTTIDNPTVSSVITYKRLGMMIPVVHNDNMGDGTGITDPNQKSTIEISTAQHVYYTVDPKDATKILQNQTPPDIDGYVPVNSVVNITDPFKDTEVVYTVDQNHQAKQGNKKTVHEIINYIGPDGKSIWPSTDNSFDFEINNGQATNASDHTFAIQYMPVVDGYVADRGQVDAVTVKPDDKNTVINVKYSKVGNIIAVDENGKELTRVAYTNNPFDASAVEMDETAPNVDGYTPNDQTVSPVFPDQDTKVVYVHNANGKHITINFVDTTTGSNIMSKTLTGVEGTPCTYNPASDIAYVRAQGYDLGDDLVPDNLVFGNEDMSYDIDFGHKTIQMSPDDTGFVDGSPVDPSSPYGAKGQLYDWKRETKHTVHYSGAGAATPKDVVQKDTWTRHFTIDEVTGAKTIVDDWQSSLGDDYSDVGTPVVQTYHADKQRIPTRRISIDHDIDDQVTYKRNGRMILDFYDQNGVKLKTKKGPYWITDPGDPTAVMPNEKVPMFTDYVPMVRMISPESPEKDTHVAYIHIPDKIIVPVVPPNCPPPTAAMVVEAAEEQIGKPIEHPVIIAKNKITKPSDLVYAYDEETGSRIGDNVKANWRKFQRRGSYYNNTQEGYDSKYFTKQTPADVNDRSNTTKDLNDGEMHDLTEAEYDSYHDGRAENTEVKDEAKDKGITLKHNDGDDITEIMFQKINHTQTYTDNKQFRNTDLPDISNQVWENTKWNTDDFGNHYNPSPADTLGASAMALFAMPSSINMRSMINDLSDSKAESVQTQTAKVAIPKMQAMKVGFRSGHNGAVPTLMSLAAMPVSANTDSPVGSEDWEPTTYYAVVINGQVVKTGLTKDEMQQYVAQHELPDISGYTLDAGQDTGISYTSPDNGTKIIYYHKTGTQPGDNTNPNNPDNPNHGNTDNPSNPDNPNNPDHGNTNPDNPSTPDHGNTNPDNPNHSNTDNPSNPDNPNNPDHGNTNPDNPSTPDHSNTNPDNPNHGNTDNPANPNNPDHGNTNPDKPNHGNTDNPSNPDHSNTNPDNSDHGNTDNPTNPDNPSNPDHGNTNPDNPNNPSNSDHGNTNPDNPNHDNTDNPTNPNNPNHGNTDNPSGSDHGNTNPSQPTNPNNNGQNGNSNDTNSFVSNHGNSTVNNGGVNNGGVIGNTGVNGSTNGSTNGATTINNGNWGFSKENRNNANNGNTVNGVNGSSDIVTVPVNKNSRHDNSSSRNNTKRGSNVKSNSNAVHGKKRGYTSSTVTRGRYGNLANGHYGSVNGYYGGSYVGGSYANGGYGTSAVNGAGYSSPYRNSYGASAKGYNGSYSSFAGNGYSYANSMSNANTDAMSDSYVDNSTVYASAVSNGDSYDNSVATTDNGSALTVAQAQYQANSGYLPQTGNKQSMAVMALGLVLVSASFGLAVRKHY